MRRYDDPVEVRKGWIGGREAGVEGPEQFLWRGRLWQVRAVLAHWVETAPWWQSAGVRAVIGSDEPLAGPPSGGAETGGAEMGGVRPDLVVERETWRVEAGRGRALGPDGGPDPGGIFDLSFDWDAGSWLLVGCAD